jgi:hypothetical protein
MDGMNYPYDCPECGQAARREWNVSGPSWDYYCSNPRCELADDAPEIQREMLNIRLDDDDFAIGDSFWIGEWEFTVTSCKKMDGISRTEKLETFTGRVGKDHNRVMDIGIDFIVIVFDEDSAMYAIRDIPENQELILDTINGCNIMEWTRVRAYDIKDAKLHAYQAHDQYYDKLCGVENWIDSAVLGIQAL